MSKFYIFLSLVAAIVIGILTYVTTEKDIRHSNALYLKTMQAGTYQLREQNYTEWFSLETGNRFHQHILMDDGKVIDTTGHWSLAWNSPEALQTSDIVLYDALSDFDLHGKIQGQPKGYWDYTVPASAFYESRYVYNKFVPDK